MSKEICVQLHDSQVEELDELGWLDGIKVEDVGVDPQSKRLCADEETMKELEKKTMDLADVYELLKWEIYGE